MIVFIRFLIVYILLVSGCSSESQLVKTYEIILEPVKEPNLISYYVSGLPIGATSFNNYNIIFNLQPAEILGDDYLRLWFLIQNNSGEEVLFEPIKEFKLVYNKLNNSGTKAISPESPLEILKSIEYSKQADVITQTIGSALKSLGTTNTTIKSQDNDIKLEIEDANSKREENVTDLNQKIYNTMNWYDFYSESFNEGVLRRNTLFPKQSINGFIYFKLPTKKVDGSWVKPKNKGISVYELKDYNISLQGQVLLKGETIEFISAKSE